MSPVVQQIALLFAVATAGAFAHYLNNWLHDIIKGSLWHYLFVDCAKRTALAFFTLYGLVLTLFLEGHFVGMTIQQIILSAFPIGYTIDSAVNKSTSENDSPVSK